MRSLTASLAGLLLVTSAFTALAADAPPASSGSASAAAAKQDSRSITAAPEVNVSVTASGTRATEVLASLAKQSKEKIVVESTVKGKVTVTLKDAGFEAALGAVCDSGKIVWRKLYIAPDSKLLEQPDRLAATVRLMSGLSFPDLVIGGSFSGKVAVHSENAKAIEAAVEPLAKELGLTRVYLITNDAAVAAKALAKDEQSEKETPVGKYTNMTKQMVDMFMKMTPEEREQALLEGLNLIDQLDPGYMSSVMQTMMDADPQMLRQMMAKQTQVLFNMTTDQRRAMMRLNMEIMTYDHA